MAAVWSPLVHETAASIARSTHAFRGFFSVVSMLRSIPKFAWIYLCLLYSSPFWLASSGLANSCYKYSATSHRGLPSSSTKKPRSLPWITAFNDAGNAFVLTTGNPAAPASKMATGRCPSCVYLTLASKECWTKTLGLPHQCSVTASTINYALGLAQRKAPTCKGF